MRTFIVGTISLLLAVLSLMPHPAVPLTLTLFPIVLLGIGFIFSIFQDLNEILK